MVSEAIKLCAEIGEVFRKLEECMGDDLETLVKHISKGPEHSSVKQNWKKSTYKKRKISHL
jgi:hypothetical protein